MYQGFQQKHSFTQVYCGEFPKSVEETCIIMKKSGRTNDGSKEHCLAYTRNFKFRLKIYSHRSPSNKAAFSFLPKTTKNCKIRAYEFINNYSELESQGFT